MPSGKQLCQSMACFAIGGIITVMFIKILVWQRSQNQEERVAGERQMIVPVQEVGNDERQEERIVQGYTGKIKIPREQDDL